MYLAKTCFLQDERVEGALVAWAASTQCAGGQSWTAAGKEEEEEELEDKEDK